jgi:hypothetical protein
MESLRGTTTLMLFAFIMQELVAKNASDLLDESLVDRALLAPGRRPELERGGDGSGLQEELVDRRLMQVQLPRRGVGVDSSAYGKVWGPGVRRARFPQQRLRPEDRNILDTLPEVPLAPASERVPLPYSADLLHPSPWQPHAIFPYSIPARVASAAILRGGGTFGGGSRHHENTRHSAHRRRHAWSTNYAKIMFIRSDEAELQEDTETEELAAAAAAAAARQVASYGAAAGGALAADAATQAAAKARERVRAARSAAAGSNHSVATSVTSVVRL